MALLHAISSSSFFLLLLHFSPAFSFSLREKLVTYDVSDFGAIAGGQTDASKAFMSAWAAACAAPGFVAIRVPPGVFLVGEAMFSGPCRSTRITFQIAGTLVAPADYGVLGESWIQFYEVEGVSIVGGTLDGRGASLWACKRAGDRNCPQGAVALRFTNSREVTITGRLTLLNSEQFHIVIYGCEAVTLEDVTISAPANSPNTDGIHIEHSAGVTITGATIGTGDDCVSIGPGSTDLWIERISCGPGHGVSIGSLGKEYYYEAGVKNVTVTTAEFVGTLNGLRIKTWARPSRGFVRQVAFEHAAMWNVKNPIIIDQNYCPDEPNCPRQSSGVKISDVRYSDIHGSSATVVAVRFDCSSSNRCSGIRLEEIKLTYGNEPAISFCNHAAGFNSGVVQPRSCLSS
ncbi:Polygalacturonase [Apostasia shenzhenica]|uniref:Exopolygalacturonase n=1 Tax=Apostasia shenzhenica TaxID=1088818 RepID=A0A2I0AXD6_9ASPA|nr:Polygalacturonase [Apostasia shenzhenica]